MSLRWAWSIFAVFLTVVISMVMAFSLIQAEQDVRRVNEGEQTRMTLSILSRSLAMPMMANSRAEVDTLLEGFLESLPGAVVYLRWSNGDYGQFGEGHIPEAVGTLAEATVTAAPVPGTDHWYASGIDFNGVQLGTIALYMPESGRAAYTSEFKLWLAMVVLLLALMAGAAVYRFTGSLSRSMRALSKAAGQVGAGDYLVHIANEGSREVGQGIRDFNQMVSHLAQRQATQELFGRYRQPQQVADAFDRKLINTDCPVRNAVVMAVSMVDFPGYMPADAGVAALSGLNRFFVAAGEIVSVFGGHIDHISGDRLLAVFNHPANLREYEAEAAKSALAIIEVSKKLSLFRADADAATFRVGLVQGELLTGYLGAGRQREFRVAGAAVTLAEQLAMLAAGQEVFVAGTLLQQLQHGFIQQDMGIRRLADGHEMHCARIEGATQRISSEIHETVAKALAIFEVDNRAGK